MGAARLHDHVGEEPADAYSLDPATLKVTRWTESETGGLDTAERRARAGRGEELRRQAVISGFLYRPDPAKFPGKRPVIVNIHGGPESQSRPGFLGRNNYFINELGVAIFFPNVRGSAGYGKTFVSLDNGPFKREDSSRTSAPSSTGSSRDPASTPTAVAVTGGSYGGYMTLRLGHHLRRPHQAAR